ncbi:hypothetical protein BVD23_24550 [Salmonella enterica]|nr:hypothetical protein [Salmonella enterica]HCM1831501.1 hypothetical protein [Salmonella enterica subsp. salamae serovar 48:z81:z39]HCM1882635.1 hypothetical protein [Salmonella enterica subsp. salamae serovar 60:z10:z39]EAX8457751.1 hypothetical protein [Salmonella enterica]EAX8555960.1 hypothetical protein [Salmonella enterica]
MSNGKNPDSMYSDSKHTGYLYGINSIENCDADIITLFVGCTCGKPIENYPFQRPVFDWLKEISILIIKYSERLTVPPVAVAGALADEYNTRFMPDYSYAKKQLDYLQDEVIPKGKYTEYPEPQNNEMSSRDLERQYETMKKNDPDNINRTIFDRLSNTVAGDYGKGNISLRTAYDMYDEEFDNFHEMSRLDILRYLVTDEGTVHFAALSIKKALNVMSTYIQDLPPRKQEAVLITYFKQGDNYRRKFINRSLKNNPNAKIRSGEGCRTCFQRQKIAEAIGVQVKILQIEK